MDESSPQLLLEKARRYRELGNSLHDRQTRLALLELAFEFEERAGQLARVIDPSAAAQAIARPSVEDES